MTYQTRTILRRTLPVVFWLLAVGGAIGIPLIIANAGCQETLINPNYWWGFAAAALVMTALWLLYRIDRHMSSAEECFQIAVLLGIASYWVPTVVFMTLPFGLFIVYQNAFNFRSFLATLLGFCFVAIHAAICIWQGWINCPWADFFSVEYLWGWIPVLAMLTAWLSSTIARKTMRER